MKKKEFFVAELDMWEDDNGCTRQNLHACTFYQLHCGSLQGHVTNRYHGLVSDSELLANAGIWIMGLGPPQDYEDDIPGTVLKQELVQKMCDCIICRTINEMAEVDRRNFGGKIGIDNCQSSAGSRVSYRHSR